MDQTRRISTTKDQLSAYFSTYFGRDSPLGSLYRIHAYSVAADTFTTVALAGSLFFSISPDAAKSKVTLYLGLTVAPFAIISPILSPALDRGSVTRRVVLLMSAVVRMAAALMMARDISSPLIFPFALAILISSKFYLVAKAALVPELLGYAAPPTGTDSRDSPGPTAVLVRANSRLSLLGALVGIAAGAVAVAVLKIPHLGAAWLLRLELIPLVLMVGELSALARSAKRLANQAPLPDIQVSLVEQLQNNITEPETQTDRVTDRAPQQRSTYGDSVVLMASAAMAVLRAGVGFFTFLLAFTLKRENSHAYVYGLALLASAAGAILSTTLTPRARRFVTEQQLLLLALAIETVAALGAATVPTIASEIALSLVVGFVASAGKLSFDAIVQHHISTEKHGRTFARYEMRFQLAWVAGALIPTIVALPVRSGDVVVASSALVAALFFATGRAALRFREQA